MAVKRPTCKLAERPEVIASGRAAGLSWDTIAWNIGLTNGSSAWYWAHRNMPELALAPEPDPRWWTEREALDLIVWHREGVAVSQIAQRLNRPLGSVSSRIAKLQREGVLERRWVR